MGYTLDAYGKPVFSKSPTQTVVDMQVIADFADEFANVRADTSAERDDLLPAQLRPGMLFSETDTGLLLRWDTATGWTVLDGVPVVGTVESVPPNTVWNTTLTKVGKRVYFEGRVHKTSGATFAPQETVGILPGPFRPVKDEVFIGALAVNTGATWSASSAYVRGSGSIQVNMQSATLLNTVGFTATWLVP